MGWKRVEFGTEGLARQLPTALKEAFEGVYRAAGAPANAALFESEHDGRLYFHFSPGAAALFDMTLRTLAPKRGSAPPPSARLLVGHPETCTPR